MMSITKETWPWVLNTIRDQLLPLDNDHTKPKTLWLNVPLYTKTGALLTEAPIKFSLVEMRLLRDIDYNSYKKNIERWAKRQATKTLTFFIPLENYYFVLTTKDLE